MKLLLAGLGCGLAILALAPQPMLPREMAWISAVLIWFVVLINLFFEFAWPHIRRLFGR